MTLATCTLANDALKLVLFYVGYGFTLLDVEKACRRLKAAVEDDTVWAVPSTSVMFLNERHQPSDAWAKDTQIVSRLRSCVSNNLRVIDLEQECASNILTQELGSAEYSALARWRVLPFNTPFYI
jgi:hypothetical protein